MSQEILAARMAALGSTTRLELYRQLVRAGADGLPVAALQERLGIPASTLSHHLRALRDVGLVQQERRGTTLLQRADYGAMEDTFALFTRECCLDEPRAARSPRSPSRTAPARSDEPCC